MGDAHMRRGRTGPKSYVHVKRMHEAKDRHRAGGVNTSRRGPECGEGGGYALEGGLDREDEQDERVGRRRDVPRDAQSQPRRSTSRAGWFDAGGDAPSEGDEKAIART